MIAGPEEIARDDCKHLVLACLQGHGHRVLAHHASSLHVREALIEQGPPPPVTPGPGRKGPATCATHREPRQQVPGLDAIPRLAHRRPSVERR